MLFCLFNVVNFETNVFKNRNHNTYNFSYHKIRRTTSFKFFFKVCILFLSWHMILFKLQLRKLLFHNKFSFTMLLLWSFINKSNFRGWKSFTTWKNYSVFYYTLTACYHRVVIINVDTFSQINSHMSYLNNNYLLLKL